MILKYSEVGTGYSTKEKAESVAAKLRENDDDWKYVVVHPEGSKWFFVEVYDERGEFVARFTEK